MVIAIVPWLTPAHHSSVRLSCARSMFHIGSLTLTLGSTISLQALRTYCESGQLSTGSPALHTNEYEQRQERGPATGKWRLRARASTRRLPASTPIYRIQTFEGR
jgi:hypothetical protein